MVQVPNNFMFSAEQSTASFDYFDYATGQGYRKHYAGAAYDSASLKYFLTTQTIDGDGTNVAVTINNTNIELNFDLDINKPCIIGGADSLVNWTTVQNNTIAVYCIFTVYHVRGVTETSIGTIQSNTFTATVSPTYLRRCSKIPLTRKKFAIGDKLRLEVKFYTSGASDSSLFFDPGSRRTETETGSGGTIGTDLSIVIPFKIDL